jgi:hypothetical protein
MTATGFPTLTTLPVPARAGSSAGERGVVDCYSGPFHRIVFKGAGLEGYNEGRYVDEPGREPNEAVRVQNKKIVERALYGKEGGAWRGHRPPRLLEIGCGNGGLLEVARSLGAEAVGITLVPVEVDECRARGLTAYCLNYRDIGPEWTGQFDAVVLKGSIEHFVQPLDVVERKDAAIYAELFAIIARVLDPGSPSGRVTNSTIEYLRRPDPRDLMRSPFSHPRGSDARQWAWLHAMYSGWHPCPGELAERAGPLFSLESEENISEDYRLSAERCLGVIKRALRRPKLWREAARSFLKYPRPTAIHAWGLYISQSTNWYFRGASPPAQGVLQTWKRA